MRKISWIFFFLFSLNATLSAQRRLPENTKINLLTCDPGDELYSVFGHSAFWVSEPKSGLDQIFNYGTFDFSTPNFYGKFVRGKLPYKLGLQRMKYFMREYQRDGRGVRMQELLLTPEEKQELYNFLLENYKPENRAYQYDFFYDNCASRIVDVIDSVVAPRLIWEGHAPPERSFRSLLDDYIGRKPWTDFGIDLILGQESDKVASFRQQMFLPDYLAANLSEMKIDRDSSQSLLLSEPTTIIAFPNVEQESAWWQRPAPLFWILCGLYLLAGFWLPRDSWFHKLDLLWFGVAGIAGALFLFMWLGTDHDACYRNFNMLWANPLYLFLLPAVWRRLPKKWERNLLIFCAVLLVLTIVGFKFLPQELHVAVIPLAILFLGRIGFLLFPSFGSSRA